MSKIADPGHLAELRTRLKALDEAFHSLYGAYYGRRELHGRVPDFETLRSAAEEFIRANYDYQKARYGKIVLKLSVSKLIR
jgi:hypothetical protein